MDENNYWNSLKKDFMKYVENEILKPLGEFKRYSRSMDLLIDFADRNGNESYSPEIGIAFFESEKLKDYVGDSTLGYRRACIRHLNVFLFGGTFWQRKPRNLFKYKTNRAPLECPNQFVDIFEDFMVTINRLGLKEITVEQYRRTCIMLLKDFDSQGVCGWESRVVSANYALVLPRMAKKRSLPSVYSEEEIDTLLKSVERFTPQGKRDYAMLLMALRLGLRQSDIREIQFENVDFERSQVSLIQYKTGVALRLSLPDEVASALHDYIDNGRENSETVYIFTNGYGMPLTRTAVTHIISRHFEQAKIDVGSRHHGPHSLRMTFASQLDCTDTLGTGQHKFDETLCGIFNRGVKVLFA